MNPLARPAFRKILAASIGAAFLSGAARAADWTVDTDASALGFVATQNGKAFEGRFETWTADIAFDPTDLAASRIAASISLESAATGDKQRDKALPGSDWFNVKKTPTATFTSTEIVADPDGEGYLAKGVLDLRGVEKPLDLHFDVTIDGDAATARGEAIIVRTEHGVGQGEFASGKWVSVDVKVTVDISATKSPA
ncbi:MAG: polyisoprenoid-binding protein [Alphaproteobacteria bacterium]|nr:polyisoprenoid-binding protein [Alphaproteobacteria bacterium]